jgi:hypothetical protein
MGFVNISAEFQNILLPKTKAAEVCDALTQAFLAEGYRLETDRHLFDREYNPDEKQFFVLSNEKWCVVLTSDSFEPANQLRRTFRNFPAMIELWSRDGGWGYRLWEAGRWKTGYCSKRGPEDVDEPLARSWSDVSHLARVCGIPGAEEKLRRVEAGRFLFTEKACGGFAGALEVPVAILSFYNVKHANAGITEERQVAGWKCRLLCFKKSGEAAIKAPSLPGLSSLTAEQRADFERRLPKLKARMKVWRMLLAPLIFLGGLLVMLVVGLALLLMSFGRLKFVHTLCFGKTAEVANNFVEALRKAEPKRLHFQDGVVVNTRHGCSIAEIAPAKVLPEFAPRKGAGLDELVFDIQLEDQFVSCTAHPASRTPTWRGIEILEKRSCQAAAGMVEFEKRRTTSANWIRFQYVWTLNLPRATYQFFCSSEKELAPGRMETLDRIVNSFKIQPAPS